MASKTVSLSEDAYARLARLRKPGESFSDVVRRITPGRSLTELAGLFTKAEGKALAEAVEEMRGERLQRRQRRLRRGGSR